MRYKSVLNVDQAMIWKMADGPISRNCIETAEGNLRKNPV